ncbi:Carbohydrate esterase 4 protein [Tulasnella sp. 427]|nr:Carbohydrate esterase 4 protein [Tulasnella sp. 427]
MFAAPRLFALSLLAALAAALPATLGERAPELSDISPDEALSWVERATLAPVYSKCTVPNTVAITFDDGPYIYNDQLLATLKQYNAKATWFVNGNNYECIYSTANEKRLKERMAAGHQIASHTWAHLDWTTLSASKLKSEMTKTDTALVKILGVKPAFVRPPYGSYNTQSRQVAAANSQSIVIWDFDSGDSVGKTPAQSKTLYKNIAAKHPSNILTLNHETEQGTAVEVIPYALKVLQGAGYKFVTVAQCLGDQPAYVTTTTPAKRDSTWKC